MTSRRVITRLLAALAISAITTNASAQLLPLQPLLGTINTAACSLPLLATSTKVDAAVQRWARLGGTGQLRVIVSAQPGLLGTVEAVLAALNLPLLGELPGINAIVADVNSLALSTLTCSLAVSSVSVDAKVNVTATTATAYSVRSVLGVPGATPTAAGVGVAVIDSGIAPSADFGNRVSAFYDFTGSGVKAAAPSDQYGHGTHVAGLIAGSAALAGGADYRGVAPQAVLVGMKVLDATGSGRTSDVIRAVEYATAQKSRLGIQIINLSLGHPIFEPAARDPLVRAVELASRAGIVVVAAAGNLGYNAQLGASTYAGITSPGNAPSAITVGAVMTKDTLTRRDDEVAPYSSRGPTWYDGYGKPDVVAPGHGLVSVAAPGSTLVTQYPAARVGSSYLRLSGTSMATAVATGAVALVLEANRVAHPNAPPLTPNAVKALLQYSSTRLRDPKTGLEYDDLTQGAGSLNVAGALDVARAIDTSVPLGSYWWTLTVRPSTTIGTESYTWSNHIVWGSQTLWGSTIDTNQNAWALKTVWGNPSTTWGSHIVWGTNVVWTNPATWSQHIVWGSSYIGTSTNDNHIVWGSANDPNTTVWGNLADASNYSQ